MTASARLNDHTQCVCCARRADGLAVGKPGRLAWYCQECGHDLAKSALAMIKTKELDVYETRACEAVAALCGLTEVRLPADELPQFIAWVIAEFGPALRKQLEGGEPPF